MRRRLTTPVLNDLLKLVNAQPDMPIAAQLRFQRELDRIDQILVGLAAAAADAEAVATSAAAVTTGGRKMRGPRSGDDQ